MLSIDLQFMLDEEKLTFLTWHRAAWHHDRYGDQ